MALETCRPNAMHTVYNFTNISPVTSTCRHYQQIAFGRFNHFKGHDLDFTFYSTLHLLIIEHNSPSTIGVVLDSYFVSVSVGQARAVIDPLSPNPVLVAGLLVDTLCGSSFTLLLAGRCRLESEVLILMHEIRSTVKVSIYTSL
jgi:hypothetical protein